MSSETVGKKNDQEKPRLDLIPVSAIRGLSNVLTFGAKKYSDRNWEKGIAFNRIYGALLRHLTSWWDGEDKDPESGLSHLDHVLANAAFLREMIDTHPDLDNRPKCQPVIVLPAPAKLHLGALVRIKASLPKATHEQISKRSGTAYSPDEWTRMAGQIDREKVFVVTDHFRRDDSFAVEGSSVWWPAEWLERV